MKQYLINLSIALTAIFAPAKEMIITSVVLIIVDLITGLLAARKMKEPITSAGLRRTIVKLLVYESAILLGYLTQKYLTTDAVPVANIAAGFIGLTEMISCMENINILGGDNLLKSLLEKLGSINQQK